MMGTTKAEFVELIEQTKAHLRFRQTILPSDLDLSKECMGIIRSWKVSAKKTEPRLSEPQLRADAVNSKTSGSEIQANMTFQLRGEGNPNADLFIVAEQARRGVSPYEGPGGELLLKILGAIELTRASVYITTIPVTGPVTGAVKRIRGEIDQVKPKVVCTLGPRPVHALLNTKESLGTLRGRFHRFDSISLMPTFHPASLVEDSALKRPVWEDMKMIRAMLGV